MGGLQEDEVAFFAGGLDEHQRVYLHRLLGECLSSLPGDAHPGEAEAAHQLALIRDHMQPLVRLLGCLRQFQVSDEGSDIRPFGVQLPEPGHALVTLSPRIANWNGLWNREGTEWLTTLKPARVTVDMRRLTDTTSTVIAWLVTLAGKTAGGRIQLVNPSARIAHSLRVLRLEHLLVLPPGTP
jgi:hypothetical protein